MNTTPRYLTKSRFKLALECPSKLYYAGKAGYLDNSLDDSFLAALAEGGYQVGALACLLYPGGEAVADRTHAEQLERTRVLLEQEDVTIYEAALQAQGLFVRVDILRKRGRQIELIEVKAKSYSERQDGDLRGAKGQLARAFLPYLQDIAFQRHVAGLAYPQFEYQCFLMLADKDRAASVDGLNQRFRVHRKVRGVAVQVAAGLDAATLGAPILTAVCVNEQVSEILEGVLPLGARTMPFDRAVAELAAAYREDRFIEARPGAACASCQYRSPRTPAPGEPASGFHECWKRAFGWSDADFEAPNVLDLWNFRKKDGLVKAGVLKLRQVTQEDISNDAAEVGADGLTVANRQWFQVSGRWPGGGPFFFDAFGFAATARTWRYPLHFIDFETAAVPIPFVSGRHPYETTAFQFSHHVMHADGRVEHRTQFLDATPGRCPNEGFVRALKEALSRDDGTVFRWAAHENTVLTHLRGQFLRERPEQTADLASFIDTITTRKGADGQASVGHRAMVDLCKLAERHFFHPDTQGSSSLKKVLPALMRSSDILRRIYGTQQFSSSLNWDSAVHWWQEDQGRVLDPYKLLPPIFDDVTLAEQEALDIGLGSNLREGGAAMAAYARLQFEDLSSRQRQAIESALLRYCELDTLAMVMAVQAWLDWASPKD